MPDLACTAQAHNSDAVGMSGFLPGLAQLAAAGLVKAGISRRPENKPREKSPLIRPRDTTNIPTPAEKIQASADVPEKEPRPGSHIDLTA